MNRLAVLVISILAIPIVISPFMMIRTSQSTAEAKVETFGSPLEGGTGGVSIDGDGNVYVADFGAILGDTASMGRRIFKLDPSGESSVFASGFEGASGNEFDPNGFLYQSSIRGNFISRIAPDGTWTEYVTEGIAGPVGLAFDATGNLYVANCGNHTIQRVTPDGLSSVFASDSLLRCPNGIVVGLDDDLYVANFDNGDVLRIDRDASVSLVATMPGGNNGHLTLVGEHLYVVDRGAHQIQKVGFDGTVEVFAGTGARGRDNGPALSATFSYPNDIAVSPDGRFLFVNEIASLAGDHSQLTPMVVRRITLPN